MDFYFVIPALVAIAALFLLLPTVVFGIQAARRPMPVECPETHDFVQVRVDPLVSVKRLFRDGTHEVIACTRWPERGECDRKCERCL